MRQSYTCDHLLIENNTYQTTCSKNTYQTKHTSLGNHTNTK